MCILYYFYFIVIDNHCTSWKTIYVIIDLFFYGEFEAVKPNVGCTGWE